MPVVLEFAGLPASGKSTAIKLLQNTLVDNGFSCKVIPTATSVSPLERLKKDWTFEVWSLCRTVKYLLETSVDEKNDVVLIERGLIDSLCWIEWFIQTGQLDIGLAEKIIDFAMIPRWIKKIDLTIVLHVNFETALQRRGEAGRIVNHDMYLQLRTAYDSMIKQLMLETDNILVYATDQLTRDNVHRLVLENVRLLGIDV